MHLGLNSGHSEGEILLLRTIILCTLLEYFVIAEICDDIDIACYSGIGCVDKSLICDGVRHCLDGSDEWECC